MAKQPIDPSLAGSRFAPVNNRCRRCGQLTNTISLTCHACLQKIFLSQQMENARETLRAMPRQALEIGRGKDHILHLALFDAPNVGWCGAELTEPRAKRRRTPAPLFPPDLCAACTTLFREVTPCP